MTNTAPRTWRIAIVFMILALLASTFGSTFSALSPGNFSPSGGDASRYLAATTISTKTAKNTVKNGILGIDVSKWQGNINWKKVAGDNVKFAFARATYGTTPDPYFVSNAKGARENSIKIGAYHFATFKTRSAMKKEANAFIKQLNKVTLTYPAVLDVEYTYNLSKKNLTTLTKEFLDIVADAGYKVMLYSYNNFFTKNLNMTTLKNYDIWVANYIDKPSGVSYKVWQYSQTGKVSGISGHVDMNIATTDLSKTKKATNAALTASNSTTTSGSGSSARNPSETQADGEPVKVAVPKPSGNPTTTKTPSSSGTKTPTSSGSTKTEEKKQTYSSISNAGVIINFLKEYYATSLTNTADLKESELITDISKAFQTEINKQLGGTLEVNGTMNKDAVTHLATVTFTVDETKGRITTLLQSMLSVRGYLTTTMTGRFDSDTVAAIKALQTASGLEANGKMDSATWTALLGVN